VNVLYIVRHILHYYYAQNFQKSSRPANEGYLGPIAHCFSSSKCHGAEKIVDMFGLAQ
jgi:hypothetical protein